MLNDSQWGVYQIYYDASSFQKLDAGFIALDNTDNLRPDWYELWVMMNHLRKNPPKPDEWRGYLSSKFHEKTGISATQLRQTIGQKSADADIFLLGHGWDQIAYFPNVFIQGDFHHPGLMGLSQEFLLNAGIDCNLNTMLTHSRSAVFSNYIVAREPFWSAWLKLAGQFFDYVEYGEGIGPKLLRSTTAYGEKRASMKTFVQERLCSVLLRPDQFRVIAPYRPALTQYPLQPDTYLSAEQYPLVCDQLKQDFESTGQSELLDIYRQLVGRHPSLQLGLTKIDWSALIKTCRG